MERENSDHPVRVIMISMRSTTCGMPVSQVQMAKQLPPYNILVIMGLLYETHHLSDLSLRLYPRARGMLTGGMIHDMTDH